MQGSGGFAKIVCGFACANDAVENFVQAPKARKKRDREQRLKEQMLGIRRITYGDTIELKYTKLYMAAKRYCGTSRRWPYVGTGPPTSVRHLNAALVALNSAQFWACAQFARSGDGAIQRRGPRVPCWRLELLVRGEAGRLDCPLKIHGEF